MNGRFFDGRQLVCEYYDGKTDYRVLNRDIIDCIARERRSRGRTEKIRTILKMD
jgi:hypothetical protein